MSLVMQPCAIANNLNGFSKDMFLTRPFILFLNMDIVCPYCKAQLRLNPGTKAFNVTIMT